MENDKNENKDHRPLGTEGYGKFRTGAGVTEDDKMKSVTNEDDIEIRNRAKLDGRKGEFESEHLEPEDTDSDLPGANEKADVGTAASGAGLGGNMGRGTANSD